MDSVYRKITQNAIEVNNSNALQWNSSSYSSTIKEISQFKCVSLFQVALKSSSLRVSSNETLQHLMDLFEIRLLGKSCEIGALLFLYSWPVLSLPKKYVGGQLYRPPFGSANEMWKSFEWNVKIICQNVLNSFRCSPNQVITSQEMLQLL